MDAILFSAKPSNVDDAVRHLASHVQVYWEVGFAIKRERFTFPMLGYIHICRQQVRYKATIQDIVPFSPNHYEDPEFAPTVKPDKWIREWMEEKSRGRSPFWRNALVIMMIEHFSCPTVELRKLDGSLVRRAPQAYTRVRPWGEKVPTSSALNTGKARPKRIAAVPPVQPGSLAEQNLEEFVIQQMESIEPGLTLFRRQLRSPVGRLDLLARDSAGYYVVIELKRTMGADQVVGRILCLMGWVSEVYRTDKVRGIIVVGRKDPLLGYGAKAAPSLLVKEFSVSIK